MFVQDGIKSQTTAPATRKVCYVDFFVPDEIERILIFKLQAILTLSKILLKLEITCINSY